MHEETSRVIDLMRAAGSRIKRLGRPHDWQEVDDEPVRPLSVLLVEDNALDAELTCRALRTLDPEIVIVDTSARARQVLEPLAGQRRAFDVVILDLDLPDSSPEHTLVFAHELALQLPVVVLSGFDDYDDNYGGLLGFLHKRADNSGWLVEKLCELMTRHGARALAKEQGG